MHRLIAYIVNHQVILLFVLVLFSWFLFTIRDILIGLFISYIVMATLLPSVQFLKQKGVPNSFAVIAVYSAALLVLFLLIFPLIPFLVEQVQALFLNLPNYLNTSASVFGFELDVNQLRELISSQLEVIGGNILALTTTLIEVVFAFLTIFIIGLYLLLTHDQILKSIVSFFFPKNEKQAFEVISRVDAKMGAWLRGQIALSLIIGVLTWLALTILGVNYALPLALIAGILEIVPTIGPIIAAIPAIIVALGVSLPSALLVAGVYLGIQLFESNVLVPKIMNKAVGLNPVAVILAVTIGGKLLGILGALLAVPFLSLIIVVYSNIKES